MAHAPFQTEEDWVDRVAEANESGVSDPTLVNASLTELEAQDQTNGLGESHRETTAQAGAGEASGNLAAERWHPADKGGMEDSYVHVPRPNDEVEIPAEAATHQPQGSNWADDVTTHEASGNTSGEAWAAQQDDGWAGVEPAANSGTADDGFHQVAGRSRGRGRGARGGNSEYRGRGGRRGNFRARGEGESRGGRTAGGRGRGSRGGAESGASA